MSSNLIDYFNKSPRLGVISTSSANGQVDSAVFGSPQMIDEKTVVAATADNRTFANLRENPYASYTIMETGDSITDWKGIRVYMKLKEHATSGELLDTIRSEAAKFVGEEGAKMIYASLIFEIYEVRPLVDFGQGWEKSI
ncbi:pyridoxamine 5'-phosphate oxidase family protein [Methanosarcina sp.]|uniref:pyridoxamine 5'-phosphate oxidase family protein n=1 Tax=Methanosarcina sp. TaxID=2213 RepID=UPI0029884E9E|nr:pyridoxamine 5'-phosphate oxidase family protein [Methanosarcina sp.]MDW5550660.1 pyridoxamine 5'-phosphate oxidase family protein [Methanosarcina sp.]MDW5552423.1 pyridoxamine 5'-phosphate oxidase family protein [Methanosarcina sp.]MDW5560154.1 pyridoxamine 5'-phosphate oxidase family protein [Methanosarcina sp.]